MTTFPIIEKNPVELPSLSYSCGNEQCGRGVTSAQGYKGDTFHRCEHSDCYFTTYIYMCPECNQPTFMIIETCADFGDTFDDDGVPSWVKTSRIYSQFPESPESNYTHIEGLPDNVKSVYEEAVKCLRIGAWTATAMLCRKMLMNVAVPMMENKAERVSFLECIEFLSKQNHITASMKKWANRVRDAGNEANHEIKPADEHDAKNALDFVKFLLILTYEVPYKEKERKKGSSFPS